MVLFLEVLDGPLAGEKYRVEPGVVFGRLEGHILLSHDSKVSGLHAKIDYDDRGLLSILDQNSANGLYLSSHRVKKIPLIPGVTFRIGTTTFKAVELDSAEADRFSPLKTWAEHLAEQLVVPDSSDSLVFPRVDLQPLSQPLTLKFVRGPQADTILTLGYAPRVGGSGGLDIEILDPSCPEKAFELLPGPGCVLLKDLSSGRVLLNNNKIFDATTLDDGDLITIGKTEIKVHYGY